jgi:lipopolysaccharide export system permease protein
VAWTLYWYILRELLKILVVTAVVLVALISFAVAIRPISDGLLSPTVLLRFLLYTAPTVLGFALPFAGAFASTLVFIRLAQDNEVLAMSASGLSYRTILGPVLAMGLVLTFSLLVLSNTAVPYFFKQAEQIVKSDVISLMAARLNQNKPFDYPPYVLYADSAVEIDAKDSPEVADRGADRALVLKGVAVGEQDKQRRLQRDYTAGEATVLVRRDATTRDTVIDLYLDDAVYFDLEKGDFAQGDLSIGPITTPNPMRDQPDFFSWRELLELGRQPERYDRVRDKMRELTLALATQRLRLAMLANADRIELRGPISADRYIIKDAQITPTGDELILRGRDGPLVVERHLQLIEGAPPDREYEAREAVARIRVTPFRQEPVIDLSLMDAVTRETGVQTPELPFPALRWPGPIFEQESREMSYDALEELSTQPVYADSPTVGPKRQLLATEYVVLHYRIRGALHERAASAASCCLLLLLGAVLSIRLRLSLPLVVYFATFVLAILTVIITNAGGNMATGTNFPLAFALGVMWSANALLLVVLGVAYCQVAKH